MTRRPWPWLSSSCRLLRLCEHSSKRPNISTSTARRLRKRRHMEREHLKLHLNNIADKIPSEQLESLTIEIDGDEIRASSPGRERFEYKVVTIKPTCESP